MGNQPRYPSAGLVPYDPAWPVRYVELAGSLQQVLGDHWQVEHIGSTSVPGLLAKPVIDLAVRIPEQETVHDNLRAFATAGWTGMTPLPTHQALFQVDHDGTRRAIAHLFPADRWPTASQRVFPAWLRAHPADRDAYANLKQTLRCGGLWGHDYTNAKAAFVQHICAKAGVPPPEGPSDSEEPDGSRSN
jgi:GrpB-like predicted nucleotidyltransferase (UPF0157 family)